MTVPGVADWSVDREEHSHAVRLEPRLDGVRPTWGEVVERWRNDPVFCDFFTELLASMPFEAFFWETPPIDASTFERPFECVVADARVLASVDADGDAFAQHFAGADEPIIRFENLGGDAMLVVPTPDEDVDCAHLAAFLRTAPRSTSRELWRRVGEAVEERLSERSMWVSTSGAGVYWLHVRLDRRPKYYVWRPYATRPR